MAVVLAACVGSDDDEEPVGSASTATTTTTNPEVSPREYLAEVEGVIQDQAYYADRVDWSAWEASLPDLLAEADVTADTYPAVRRLLGQMDRHSSLAPPGGAPRSEAADLPDRDEPAASVDAGGVGRLTLPVVVWDPEDPLGAQYVAAAWGGLENRACGWIVDLRAGGGNAWTLLMALAPLLEPGPAFGFAYRDDRTETVVVEEDGSLTGGGRPPVGPPVDVDRPVDRSSVPVAVVQSRVTASAHEFAVMAFSGRPLTRSVGTPTAGLPTAVESIELVDGSVLHLTTAAGVDRAGVVHETALPPDQEIDNPDAALDAARSWVASQDLCNSN